MAKYYAISELTGAVRAFDKRDARDRWVADGPQRRRLRVNETAYRDWARHNQDANSRTFNLIVRVNVTEREQVERKANEAGQTVSDYIRSRIGLQ